ncbi:NmrA family NAD(P)-binding protein, partial [Streptomyces sp. NPDC054835]
MRAYAVDGDGQQEVGLRRAVELLLGGQRDGADELQHATGLQGRAVTHHLLRDGWKVRALTRDPNGPQATALARAAAPGQQVADRAARRRARPARDDPEAGVLHGELHRRIRAAEREPLHRSRAGGPQQIM